ncbi:MAG: alpha-mannosidase [Nodosilinea sp.]
MPPTDSSPALSEQISECLARLRHLSQQDVQATWHRGLEATALSPSPPLSETGETWPLSSLNDRHHIVWPKGKLPLWLYQRFVWPEHLQGYPLAGLTARLALRWWANHAEIYVNGQLVQTGDIFNCWTRIELTERVIPGQAIEVALKLLSPGHDEGALVQSQLVFESAEGHPPEPGFVADELAVLEAYLTQFAPQHLTDLGDALADIAWDQLPHRERFDHSLAQVRAAVEKFSPRLKAYTIHCLGHAHLDLAWLWPMTDTWAAAEATFKSVLALQQDFPELTFTHSSPALFDWLEHQRPELFAAVQQQVRAGRWAIDAGLWVEPDLTLPGGEAIVRQILYGQRYCQEKFGQISAIAWLPDTFGFSWQLPQLLTQGGIRFFATQKLRWNDTNPFPHDLYSWQGRDGTTITGVTLPPIGTDIEPVDMAQYAYQWAARTGLLKSLWLPGVGDHGGGPTRDMLLKARRWASSPFFPTLTFSQAEPLFEAFLPPPQTHSSEHSVSALDTFSVASTQPAESQSPALPTWTDELYLELHRGCYTTHSDQKWYNRRCEDALFQAELWASLSAIMGRQPYPCTQLETAWKQVLFNQFHDILPGSSIPVVFEQANQAWQAALDTATQIVADSLQNLAQHCPLPPPPSPHARPLVLFNPLNWLRHEAVLVPLPAGHPIPGFWQAQDEQGKDLSTQMIPAALDQGEPATSLLIDVPDIPSVGYRVIWLVPANRPPAPAPPPDHWVLENPYLRIVIDSSTGDIASLLDKQAHTEALSGPGNRLQAWRDQGQYWDAWNIAPDYRDHPLEDFQLQSIEWVDYGAVRQTIRVVRTFNQSIFEQDYTLDNPSPLLVIHTRANWQETQVLVKAAFPLSVSAPHATYEIPFGAIQRATEAQTPQDEAKWEVPALRWADLSQADRGVSLLTQAKHGFDASLSQLRLTLLKAPLWPDPTADRGMQAFSYAIYPHSQGWQAAKTAQIAHNFSLTVQPCWLAADFPTPSRITDSLSSVPASASFLNLGHNSLVLAALKLAEDADSQFILRVYESAGEPSEFTISSDLPLHIGEAVNILEQPSPSTSSTDCVPFEVAPWQVVSLKITSLGPFLPRGS